MNKLCCLIIIFFTCRVCEAQNLVPNGDFEQYSSCPTTHGQIDSCLFWMNPSTGGFIGGSPDYYNQCASPGLVGVPNNWSGYQQAYSGGAYSGGYLWGYATIGDSIREYIEVPLISPLASNGCYYFEMYVNLIDNSGYTTDDIGVYFSDTAITGINNYYPLPYIPQINNAPGNTFNALNWTLVAGNYTASGGESYLIIGNFKSNLNTDTIPANGSNTTFIYCFIDKVCLIPCGGSCTTGIEEQNQSTAIKIYPNPVIDKLNVSVNNNELLEITLYDIFSRKLLEQQFTNSVSLNTSQLVKGIYLYEVRNKNGVIKKGKVVKD